MSGDVQVRFCERPGVRFPRATHLVVGFQHHEEAERFLGELRERFAKFGLALHPEKTRLIEFGRYANRDRRERGDGKPETFNFLGFTHICTKTRKGYFTVLRQTMKNRLRAKLKVVKTELNRRMHEPIAKMGAYLRSVLLGHYRYYGVPLNYRALEAFMSGVFRLWRRVLSRRSQNGRIDARRAKSLETRWLPRPEICHPYPLVRLGVITQGKSRMRNVARPIMWRVRRGAVLSAVSRRIFAT
jgi:RNA-directed DNA polymerase